MDLLGPWAVHLVEAQDEVTADQAGRLARLRGGLARSLQPVRGHVERDEGSFLRVPPPGVEFVS